MRVLFSFIFVVVFTLSGISQNLSSPMLKGTVYDFDRKFAIVSAELIIYEDDSSFIRATTDLTGQYYFATDSLDPSKNYLMEARADGYNSETWVVEPKNKSILILDFYLRPKTICIDKWFPEHFKFEMNSSALHPDDSLAVLLRFSNPEIKELLKTYSYNIVVRRSTEESDQTALDRGNSLRNLFVKMGIDAERITIENKSTNDFFYCLYCEGRVYEYQNGQGIDLTQELIDRTTDPIKRQEYEAMRRVVEVEMRRD